MAVKRYKPTTPSRRYAVTQSTSDITSTNPEKSLLRPLKKSGGRNSHGHITMRRRGGGHKRRYRLIDFKRLREDAPAVVLSVEYDPNRSARISLVQYPDGEKAYVLCPAGIKVGEQLHAGVDVEIKPGNTLPLRAIPTGTPIHNIELIPGKGGELARAAGTSAQLLAKEDKMGHVKLPSGEVRLIPLKCRATVGELSPLDHLLIVSGKAGRSRWMGRRPKVRGVAMNPVDHPHGGGEGKAGSGNPHPVSPWGTPTLGYKTRKLRKASDRFIVRKRPSRRKK
ncbi:MAG: 50S ribosomal protein L2 [Candidatus Omnitrophica bacterium]|nr:50S ribosomal protein L2 [Candidatus Omnitrophota bacterium]